MSSEGPVFSVIVPTFGRPEQLAGCLDALAGLDDSAGSYEVIVVDDGGEPAAAPVVESAADDLAVRVVNSPHQGPSAARNRGIEIASGRFLCFTDDDCRPGPDWLRQLGTELQGHPGAAAGGRMVNGRADNIYSEASQAHSDAIVRLYQGEGPEPPFVTSNNLAFPAEGLREVGGFDPKMPYGAEDRELCARWLATGRELYAARRAVVEHHHDLNLGRFLKQQFKLGRAGRSFHRAVAGGEVEGGERKLPSAGRQLALYAELARSARGRPLPEAAKVGALLFLSQVLALLGFTAALIQGHPET